MFFLDQVVLLFISTKAYVHFDYQEWIQKYGYLFENNGWANPDGRLLNYAIAISVFL